MAIKVDEILRELYMLTGKVNKDKDYLYYLLIKDGAYFKEPEPEPEKIETVNTVDTFENWFDSL